MIRPPKKKNQHSQKMRPPAPLVHSLSLTLFNCACMRRGDARVAFTCCVARMAWGRSLGEATRCWKPSSSSLLTGCRCPPSPPPPAACTATPPWAPRASPCSQSSAEQETRTREGARVASTNFMNLLFKGIRITEFITGGLYSATVTLRSSLG